MTRYTNDLKQQIECVLHWEQASHWQLHDFAILSERVLTHTNCWVEAHDLQAFWHSSEATPSLLDALAQFIDYTDWADFCDRNQISEMVPIKPTVFHPPAWEIPIRWVVIIYCLSVIASVLVGILLVWKR